MPTIRSSTNNQCKSSYRPSPGSGEVRSRAQAGQVRQAIRARCLTRAIWRTQGRVAWPEHPQRRPFQPPVSGRLTPSNPADRPPVARSPLDGVLPAVRGPASGRLPVYASAACKTAQARRADTQSHGSPMLFTMTDEPLMMWFHLSTTGQRATIVGAAPLASQIARWECLE